MTVETAFPMLLLYRKVHKKQAFSTEVVYKGIGKPEPLKGNLSGWQSFRTDETNRLVFRIENETIEILSCKGHY
jgi:Txe/YoeB family toxin of toxin-antitoxin system